ncbi:hypothetical protein C0Q70_07371 [Pomacea canaliculata]|uniref:Uncharacterized protein n=1 Tax=Pomacea canaliculata TaxID=400727 RepID=A0A2T7PEV2_POMCA|nr:hypothetical protein C0Q70_07371 [Pomacea canaliculata]
MTRGDTRWRQEEEREVNLGAQMRDVTGMLAKAPAFLLLVLLLIPSRTESQPHSACEKLRREKDVQSCLDSIRKRAEDPSAFWFGRGYNSSCQSQTEFFADCYNPRADSIDSLASRLSPTGQLDFKLLDRFMDITYQVSAGKYKACENEYSYEFEREITLDPLSLSVMTPYELRFMPKAWWPADTKDLHTLVFYDAGYFAIKALYVNIPASRLTDGEEIQQYEGPLNPTRNENPYVFLVFSQSGPVALDSKWSKQLVDKTSGIDLEEFIKHHGLKGKARTFSLNPLGDATVLPAHTHSDVIVYVTLSMSTAFPDTQRDFKDKLLTLVMADPNVPLPEFGNERLPFLHWLVVNIRGADVAAGDVVQGYMGPAPPDPHHHHYYYLVFEQPYKLDPDRLDYSAPNCSWAFRGRCRYDVSALVAEHNLKLLGVTWMRARFDEFVREVYVRAGLLPRCVACHGVPGYAVPCSSRAAFSLSETACALYLIVALTASLWT